MNNAMAVQSEVYGKLRLPVGNHESGSFSTLSMNNNDGISQANHLTVID